MRIFKTSGEILFVFLLFLFMLLSMFYHICGDNNMIFWKIYYNSIMHLFFIGLNIVILKKIKYDVVVNLIKHSSLPYFILKLIYTNLLYLQVINKKWDFVFIVLFGIVFLLGLWKIRKIKHNLTIEN